MRIFGDPSSGSLDEDDFVFLGMLPIPFDLTFAGGVVVAGPFRTPATQVFIPGGVTAQAFLPGGVTGQTFIPGGVSTEVFEET